MGVPNWLTILRVLLIPVLVLVFILPVWWARPAAAAIFVVAAATDWLDGFTARRLNQYSRLGAFLDPVADKLIVAAALVLVVMSDAHPWIAIPALIIVGREIAVSALREWMAGLGAAHAVAVSWAGKIKTAVQMAAIALMLFAPPASRGAIYFTGLALLYLAATLTVLSMSLYLRAAWPQLRPGGAEKKSGEL